VHSTKTFGIEVELYGVEIGQRQRRFGDAGFFVARSLAHNMVDLVGNGASEGSSKNRLTHGNAQGSQGWRQSPDDSGTVDSKIWKDVLTGN